MPTIEKAPPELVTFYQETMQDFPQAELRKTFGSPCAYINGHMANGLCGKQMFLRLSPSDENEFLKIPGATSFAPMQKAPMKGFVVLPEDMYTTKELLKKWISRSIIHAIDLPPKEKKPLRKRSG
jgi:TfoX/Sxy family transcriptional regulator of competence genes